jgi:hypothetical protein
VSGRGSERQLSVNLHVFDRIKYFQRSSFNLTPCRPKIKNALLVKVSFSQAHISSVF